MPLAADFGDAPDLGPGTGTGDYETLAENGGPSHRIVPGLYLGASVDEDDGTLQNSRANADDVDSALPDDEDGVLNPLDLQATTGSRPTVTLLVTNSTGRTATLSGWIDYNQDGIFDNATERAAINVSHGVSDARFSLVFPAIPIGSEGSTFARFRLSTDTAGQFPNGLASDGETEDYRFSLLVSTDHKIAGFSKNLSGQHGGLNINEQDRFGRSVASLGDINGDGVIDFAVGAEGDDTGGPARGAVHVLLMHDDGAVKESITIASNTNGGPLLDNFEFFGSSLASLGDIDGDGITDLAVGATHHRRNDKHAGSVYILLLNSDGSVKHSTKIASNTNGGPTLPKDSRFGSSLALLGDLNQDGAVELAVGAPGFRTKVFVITLHPDGSASTILEVLEDSSRGVVFDSNSGFGSSMAAIGDFNGDGVNDLVVGAPFAPSDGAGTGAVYLLLLNTDGSVQNSTKIASGTNNGPILNSYLLGTAITSLGDVDGNGVDDLAIGASADQTGGLVRGAVYIVLLNDDGAIKDVTPVD
ncbi:MAG: integrin alpha [Planctomycetota bacterium]